MNKFDITAHIVRMSGYISMSIRLNNEYIVFKPDIPIKNNLRIELFLWIFLYNEFHDTITICRFEKYLRTS